MLWVKTNRCLEFILIVGISSIAAWIWLAMETMQSEDWMDLLTDILFTLSAGYILLIVLSAGGVLENLPSLAHLAGLGILAGFGYLTWNSLL